MDTPDLPFPLSRRNFLKTTLAASLAAGLGAPAWAADQRNGIPYHTLGRTGEKVSMLGLGGYHAGVPFLESDSIALIRAAVDAGINFLDNSWDYRDGSCETRMGNALRDGYRDKVFLMTKIDGRSKAAAASQIDESLKRLQVDHVDLMQFHEIVRMSDPDRIFAPGGAMEAMLDAKKAGKLRYIGFTGHKSPEIHLKMLATAETNNFHFDTVQMPLNVLDAHFDSFTSKVVPVLLKRDIGIIGMKPLASGIVLQTNTASAVECLRYAMTLPTSVVLTGCDSMDTLNQALGVAKNFQPMTKDEIAALLAKTAPVAVSGQYEPYKTSDHFDGTTRNPQWLG